MPHEPHASLSASPGPSDPLPRWVRIVDGLSVVALVILLSNVVFQGVRLRIGDERLTATDAWRSAVILLLLVGVRHWRVRRPTLWDRVTAWARRAWASPTTAVVMSPYLASRFAVLAAGYMAVVMIGFPGDGSPPFRISKNELVNLPMRWDAGWYLGIALDGYHYQVGQRDQANIVFFPAYPMLSRVGAALLGAHGGKADSTDGLNASEYAFHQHRRIVLAGLLISIAAFGGALVYLFRLAREMLGDEAAAGAVALICAYPFSLFFSAFYTESFFLLALVGTFYHFRRRDWALATMWGLLLGLSRPNGCFTSVPLAVMALQQSLVGGNPDVWWRRGALALPASLRASAASGPSGAMDVAESSASTPAPASAARLQLARFWPAIVVAAMPGIGMLIYSAYIYSLTGRPFAWIEAQHAWGRVYEGVGGLFVGHAKLASELGLYLYSQNQPTEVLNGSATVMALLLVWPMARRIGIAYALFVLLIMLPPLAAGGFLSMGRMTSTLFPIFLYLGWALRGPRRGGLVMAFAILQGFFAAMYFTWRPMF